MIIYNYKDSKNEGIYKCDFVFLNHKIRSKQDKIKFVNKENIEIVKNAYKFSEENNKKLVYLCGGDRPPVILPNDENVIILNQSVNKNKPFNEHVIPPCIGDKFYDYLENPELSIGFVGQKNNGREKILNLFLNTELKTNFIIRNNYIHNLKDTQKNEFYSNMNNNLFTLCYRGNGNFSVRFYETLMMGRIPIQINSSSIFPYENKIDYSKIGIFIEDDELTKNDFVSIIKNFYYSKTKKQLLDIQKNNRKIYLKYFHPNNYYPQIFKYINNIIQNNFILNIGISEKNTKEITLKTNKKYNNKFYIYPFGATRMRFVKDEPFSIKQENNKLVITKIKSNNKYLWSDGWNINLKLWYPPDIKLSEINPVSLIPFNYGNIQINNLQKEQYKFGLVIPFYSRAKYVEKFLNSLKKSNLNNCLLVLVDESMTNDVNDDHKQVNKLVENYEGVNLIKVFKNKHGNMFDSILIGWDILYSYCDYLITLDSDTILKENWLEKLDECYIRMVNDYNNRFTLISGFNVESERHFVIERKEDYLVKDSVGGCNMFFKKDIYPDYIRKTLISHKWDTNIVNYVKELRGIIGTTNPSVIQHIGEESSGHRDDGNKWWDKAIDF